MLHQSSSGNVVFEIGTGIALLGEVVLILLALYATITSDYGSLLEHQTAIVGTLVFVVLILAIRVVHDIRKRII
jgi:hypothetical protein